MQIKDFSLGVVIHGNPPSGQHDTIEVVKHADRLGFHSAGFGHMPLLPSAEEYPPIMDMQPMRPYHLDPLALIPVLLHETERIKVGPGILTTASLHPFHVAKYLATLDLMSGGRLMAGFGLGAYYGGMVASLDKLGISSKLRGPMSEEAIEIIVKLWTSEKPVTVHGKYWTVIDAEVVPKAARAPYPEMWWAGDAAKSIDRAARLGFDYLLSATATIAGVRDVVAPGLVTANEEHGGRAKLASLCVAEVLPYDLSDDDAVVRVAREGGIQGDGFLVGTPRRCAEKIAALREVGVDHFVLNFQRFSSDPIERMHYQMDAWVEGVIPLLADLD